MSAQSKENVIETDVLVIGGGMSGVFASVKAKEEGANVVMVDKGYTGRSGAVTFTDANLAIFNPEWGHDLNAWKAQITVAGEYMNNPEWTHAVLTESLDRYNELVSWGVPVLKDEKGDPVMFRFPPAVLEAIMIGPWGYTYAPFLRKKAIQSGAKIMDKIMVTDLIKKDGRIAGAVGFHTRSGEFYVFKAKATVVCAGPGQFKPPTPAFSSLFAFDGESLAYRAGAEISNKEFAQAMPVAYRADRNEETRMSLEGRQIDYSHARYAPWIMFSANHVSPPYFMARRIDAEGYEVPWPSGASAIHEGRGPLLNSLEAPPEMVEMIIGRNNDARYRFEKVGADPTHRGLWRGAMRMESYIGIAVAGGAGIWSSDTQGGTSLPGLYGAGDNYNTNTFGATYPYMGLGLVHGSVTGARAGQSAAKYAQQAGKAAIDNEEIARLKSRAYAPLERAGGFDASWAGQQIQNIMLPYYNWFIKHEERMSAALTQVKFLRNHVSPKLYAKDAHELRLVHEAQSRILNAEMMLRSALMRTESRARHYREDYPRRDDPGWLALVKLREKDGEMELTKAPLPKEWWPDLSKPYNERYPMRFLGEE